VVQELVDSEKSEEVPTAFAVSVIPDPEIEAVTYAPESELIEAAKRESRLEPVLPAPYPIVFV
jgi:hypothetical protein